MTENTLFVDEDVPMDGDSGTETNVESDNKEVQELEELEDEDDEEDEEEEDDPIVESVPVYLNSVPERAKHSVHLLQYQGKPKSTKNLSHINAAVKPESGFIQVKLPLDTTRFYDESKAEEWGVQVTEHNHTGVLNKTNGGLYVAKFIQEQDQKKVVLIPVDSTTQLRPSFKYLDEIEAINSKREIPEPQSRPSHNVHILQSNAKNTKNTTNDPFASTALGESLKHVRKFDQEPWADLNWCDEESEESTILHEKITSITPTELETEQSLSDYLEKLTT